MGNSSIAFVGRVLFAVIFIGSGIGKFAEWNSNTGGPIAQHLMNPKLQAFITKTGLAAHLPKDYATQFPYVVLAAGATELLGALLFIANFPVGACLLLTFLLVTSVIVHDFWNLPADNPAHMPEMVQFLKNLALIGACFIYLGMRRTPSTKKKLD